MEISSVYKSVPMEFWNGEVFGIWMIDLFIEKDKKQKVKREIQSSSVDKLNRIVNLSVCFYTNKE